MLTSEVFFELVGVLKELGYREFETTYYKNSTFGMNALVDDKGASEIAYLYRMHLSLDIYIQHTLSQPDYCEGPVDDI